MDEQTGQGPHEHAGPDFAPPAGYRPMQGWQPGQDTPGDASPSPQYPGAAQRYPATGTPYRPDTAARPQVGIPEGGQRAKLGGWPVVGAIALGLVLATVWFVAGRDPAPVQIPAPATSAQTTRTNDPTTTATPAIPHQQSTRNPPWQVTRNGSDPRAGMAPTVQMGETAEFLDPDGIGLITVLDAQWVDPIAGRQIPAGYSYLAVQVQFESVAGTVRYSPVGAYLADADGGRYTFGYNSRIEDEYPQFEIGYLAENETMTGWVIFEAPRADMTFIFESFEEQATRVSIPGDGPVDPVTPPIELNRSFDVDSYSGKGQITVVGAAWFTGDTGAQMLGVKGRISTAEGTIHVCPMDFTVIDAKGTEYEYDFVGPEVTYRPELGCAEVVEGDQVSGWIYFVVPADEMTLQVGDGFDELGSVTIPA